MSDFKMLFSETVKAMEAFGKFVVNQSRSRLIKSEKQSAKNIKQSKLYKSIEYKFKKMPNSISIKFPFMKNLDYAKFQDLGVKGTKSNYIINKNSPFSFRSKQPPVKPIEEWLNEKKFQFSQPRFIKDKNGNDKKNPRAGQFMSYKTMSYIISKSIYQKGIPAKHFYTKSFDMAYEKLPKEVIEGFALDTKESFKKYTIS